MDNAYSNYFNALGATQTMNLIICAPPSEIHMKRNLGLKTDNSVQVFGTVQESKLNARNYKEKKCYRKHIKIWTHDELDS